MDAVDEQAGPESTSTAEALEFDEGQPLASEEVEEAVKKHREDHKAEQDSDTEPDDDALPYGACQKGTVLR